MSDGDDHDSRTEEPTEKKIQDAIEQGRLPISRDVGTALGFLSFLVVLSFVVEIVAPRLIHSLYMLLSNSGGLPLHSGADAGRYVEALNLEIGRFLAPILTLFLVFGLAAASLQGAPQIVFTRIMPDLSRISPRAGWNRLFGVTGMIELLKAVVKISVIGAAIVFTGLSEQTTLVDAMRLEPGAAPVLLLRLSIQLTSVVAIATGLLALVDYFWVRLKWRRDLRMTREELKEEFRQSEGDPFMKARMRSLAKDRARRRMIDAVPKATLVIANPTHYAIALRYLKEEGGAPLVVAKGQDLLALRIREMATRHNVPVFEKRELARAMYDLVEVDRMIPAEFYRPVAELIHFLHTLDTRR
jgi:flagellar biosynthetic protein FlhB